MKAKDLPYFWEHYKLTDKSFIKCKFCGKFSLLSTWREGEIYCHDCKDGHGALICPVEGCYGSYLYGVDDDNIEVII